MVATGKPAQVMEALYARLASLVTGSPTLPIAYPDVAFDLASSAPAGKYLEVAFFSNRPAWEGLAAGRQDQGLLQVTVVWPRNQGLIAPAQIAATVLDHFAIGTVMISGSTKVKVSRAPWTAQPILEEHETRLPVTIPWTA